LINVFSSRLITIDFMLGIRLGCVGLSSLITGDGDFNMLPNAEYTFIDIAFMILDIVLRYRSKGELQEICDWRRKPITRAQSRQAVNSNHI
jgi:hypothetical protein